MSIKILDDIMRIEQRRYVSFGDFSVTDLLQPVRLTRLKKRYGETVEDDAQAKAASLIGTFIHEGIENRLKIASYLDNNYVLERTVNDLLWHEGKEYLISGRFDVLYLGDPTVMTDIKTCSVWKKIFDPNMVEWTLQQNIYHNLLAIRGVHVDESKILAVYKDWSPAQAIRDPQYPQKMFEEIDIAITDNQSTRIKLVELFTKHVEHKDTPDDDLPACTPEERWERFASGAAKEYGIFKNADSKRATVVIRTSFEDALKYVQDKPKGFTAQSFIEIRHAQRKRCEKYCGVRRHCNHFKQYMEKKGDNDSFNEIYSLSGIL